MDWRHRALCRDEDPELFFPLGDKFLDTDNTASSLAQQIREAKAVCWRCPVITDCRTWARAAGMTGIWGGMTEDERNALPAPDFRVTFPAPAPATTRRLR